MKIKTSEMTGPALDWAVAKCESIAEGWAKKWVLDDLEKGVLHHHYDDWCNCGPIIEREKICVGPYYEHFAARQGRIDNDWQIDAEGPTPLIAAMRCYVASKLGDEVEIPEELK
jgi:hypothetical protein